jgi:hypothetical protein
MAYRFQQSGALYGDDLDEIEGSLLEEQFLAAAESGSGTRYANAAAWRDACAQEMDESPDVCGFEIWDVFDDPAPAPVFKMIYFPDSDSGMLFVASSATSAGLVLWPEGFRQKHTTPLADAAALDEGYQAARRKMLGR